jgi:maleamate amidohydrolase
LVTLGRFYENYRGVFDHQLQFGVRPALIVVDMLRAYVDPEGPFFAEAFKAILPDCQTLLAAARKVGVPIVHSRVAYGPEGREGGVFTRKIPALLQLQEGGSFSEITSAMQPAAGEWVVTKQYASIFFGTAVASWLVSQGVDTVVICGFSTSGCIRASAVDAMQFGFVPFIAEQCVADREPLAHEANLRDIAAKYGEVRSLTEVLAYIMKERA